MAVSESSFVQQDISGHLFNVWLDFLNICNLVKITTHWRIPIYFKKFHIYFQVCCSTSKINFGK